MATMLSAAYVLGASRVAYGVVARSSPLAASPPGVCRPMIAVAGAMMASVFVATVLPKSNNERSDISGAADIINSKSA